MMKKIIATLLLGGYLFAGGEIVGIYDNDTPVVSDCPDYSKAYIGGSLVADEVYSDGYSNWFSDSDYAETGIGGQLQLGYTIAGDKNFLFGIEGRFGIASSTSVDATWAAAYARADYVINKFKIYGLVGYGQTDLSTTANIYDNVVLTISDSNDDFTYGAGLAYDYSTEVQIFIDYAQLPVIPFIDSEDIDFDIISLGINYSF